MDEAAAKPTSGSVLPSGLERSTVCLGDLVDAVREADHGLSLAVYSRAEELCLHGETVPSTQRAIRRAAPEYGKREYLLSVERNGRPIRVARDALTSYRATVDEHPEFALWFAEAILSRKGERVLLPARWVCHLAGLRHRTVHLFLDHPALADHTLVQVRGVDKEEAPGCFGLPVAGHVAGLASSEEALRSELGEELGLTTEVLVDLRTIGEYEQSHPFGSLGFRNVEFHTVYRARLSIDGWLHASAAGPEVAAIGAFHVDDLQATIERFPERVASGLRGSWPIYRDARE